MARILIVDDESNMRRILASNLRLDQHRIWEAEGVESARRALLTNMFDVVITDQKMPDGEGLSVLNAANESDPSVSVVVLTSVATIELAMRQGAFDFLTKPFQPEVVRASVRRAAEHTQLVRENSLMAPGWSGFGGRGAGALISVIRHQTMSITTMTVVICMIFMALSLLSWMP
jgi:DNA-binding NtrC family response regulator